MLAERIDEIVYRHGSYRTAAAVLGVDHAHLWRVRHGKKKPGKDLLRRLKLREVITYKDIR